MVTVGADNSSLQANSRRKSVDMAWESAATWHCSDEPCKLSQWLYHDDSITNIVSCVI